MLECAITTNEAVERVLKGERCSAAARKGLSLRANKGLAIDVAVTFPFNSHNLTCKAPCESYAASKKHAYYDKDFKGTAFEFAALIFETTGGVNEEGLSLLRQLFRFEAKHQGLQLSVYCGAWARLSCSLQSSVSQCFLNRSGSVAAIEKDIDFVSVNF